MVNGEKFQTIWDNFGQLNVLLSFLLGHFHSNITYKNIPQARRGVVIEFSVPDQSSKANTSNSYRHTDKKLTVAGIGPTFRMSK